MNRAQLLNVHGDSFGLMSEPPAPVRFKQSKPVKTTEGDEVKRFGPVEAPQTAWHGSVLVRERY